MINNNDVKNMDQLEIISASKFMMFKLWKTPKDMTINIRIRTKNKQNIHLIHCRLYIYLQCAMLELKKPKNKITKPKPKKSLRNTCIDNLVLNIYKYIQTRIHLPHPKIGTTNLQRHCLPT